MNIMDFAMAIPLAIAIAVIFFGSLLIIIYLLSKITGNKEILLSVLNNFAIHWVAYVLLAAIISYSLVLVLLYKTFIY